MAYFITPTCTGCTACVRLCPTGAITGGKNALHLIASPLCIECGVCGKVCPAAAILDGSGQTCVLLKKSLWPKPVVERRLCMACNICVQDCPVSCLGLAEPVGGDPNAYPFLADEKRCIACGFCAQDCPAGAITMQAR